MSVRRQVGIATFHVSAKYEKNKNPDRHMAETLVFLPFYKLPGAKLGTFSLSTNFWQLKNLKVRKKPEPLGFAVS